MEWVVSQIDRQMGGREGGGHIEGGLWKLELKDRKRSRRSKVVGQDNGSRMSARRTERRVLALTKDRLDKYLQKHKETKLKNAINEECKYG